MIRWIAPGLEQKTWFRFVIGQVESFIRFELESPVPLTISYGPTPQGGDIWIKREDPSPAPKSVHPFPKVNFTDLFAQYVERVDGQYRIRLDLVRICFALLSLQEEIAQCDKMDQHSRFPCEASSLYQARLLDTPIVDVCVGLLEQVVRLAAGEKHLLIVARELWKGKDCAVCLTHDVDDIYGKSLVRYGYWLASGAWAAVRGSPHRLQESIQRVKRWMDAPRDPYWVFEDYVRLEESYGFRSTFFFLALRWQLSREGRRYRILDPKVRSVLHLLKRQGWEIGLHGSYFSFLNPSRLKQEKKRLEAVLEGPVMGVRQHYLRFRAPDSWRIQAGSGFQYDSTVGWPTYFGFRAGTTRPFQVFGLETGTPKLWELPLSIMDGVFDSWLFGQVSVEGILELVERYIKIARRYSGVINILWHTDRFNDLDAAVYHAAYKEILALLAHGNVFVGSCSDVLREWQKCSAGKGVEIVGS